MQFWYYFRDNFKKTWYAHWKLIKGLFREQVESWKVDSKEFIKKQTQSVLESEKEKTDHQISILENNLEEKKKILHNLIMEKDKESDLIHKKSNEKIESLKKEKTRIESEFNVYSSDISTVVVEKMQWITDKLDRIKENLWKYEEQWKEYVKKNIDTLKTVLDWVLKDTKNTITDLKNDIEDVKVKINNKNKTIKQDNWKSKSPLTNRWYVIVLLIISAFDVVAWYVSLNASAPWQELLNFFIALCIVIVWIILINFSNKASEKPWMRKQIWVLCIIFIVLIYLAYVCYAFWEDERFKILSSWFDAWVIVSAILNNEMVIIRALVLPALFVWDIIINLIDWNVILESMRFNQRISSLLSHILLVIKWHSLSKFMREEKKKYHETIDKLSEEPIPGFANVQWEVNEIQWIMKPLLDEFTNKKTACVNRIKELDDQIKSATENADKEIEWLSRKYSPNLTKYEWEIKKYEIEINQLKEQIWKAEISVREGIWLWLIS